VIHMFIHVRRQHLQLGWCYTSCPQKFTFITHADGSRRAGLLLTSVCLCVCRFFPNDMSKNDAAKITKLDTENVPR